LPFAPNALASNPGCVPPPLIRLLLRFSRVRPPATERMPNSPSLPARKASAPLDTDCVRSCGSRRS